MPRRAFSLIELVIVVIILGVVAAVALPRMTTGSENARIAALHSDLSTLNRALDLYRVEHGGRWPTADRIERQLTQFSDATGTKLAPAPQPASGVVLGPYVVKVPPLPCGPRAGATAIATKSADGVGWLYDTVDFVIRPNLTERDGGQVPDDVIAALGLTAPEVTRINAVAAGNAGGADAGDGT